MTSPVQFKCPESFDEPEEIFWRVTVRMLNGKKIVEDRWDRDIAEDLAEFAAGSPSVEFVRFERMVVR